MVSRRGLWLRFGLEKGKIQRYILVTISVRRRNDLLSSLVCDLRWSEGNTTVKSSEASKPVLGCSIVQSINLVQPNNVLLG